MADGEIVAIEPGAQVTWADAAGPKAGTVVAIRTDDDGNDVLVVVYRSMRWGKPSAQVVHVPARDVDPAHVVPASSHQRAQVARWVLAALGAKRGHFERWEVGLLGYAAAMATMDAPPPNRRGRADLMLTAREPVAVSVGLWE